MASSITLDIAVKMVTDQGTVDVTELYKALAVNGINTFSQTLPASGSKTIDLTTIPSLFFLVVGQNQQLNITVTMKDNSVVTYSGSDFVCLQASNFKTLLLTNINTVNSVDVIVYY
jgi:hypothetical protein